MTSSMWKGVLIFAVAFVAISVVAFFKTGNAFSGGTTPVVGRIPGDTVTPPTCIQAIDPATGQLRDCYGCHDRNQF